MLWHVKTVAQLVQSFGIRHGLTAYSARLAARANRSGTQVMRLPGLRHPLHLRMRTSDWEVLDQIFIQNEYAIRSAAHASAVETYYRRLLNQGKTPVIIDCGANIGLASLWYKAQYPEAHILAIEPEPENFQILSLNAAPYPAVTPIKAAVLDRETRVSLFDTKGGAWAWRTIENEAGTVETVTIPSLLHRVPNAAPLIIKVDIEGAEMDLFRSNTGWLEQAPVLVFEYHDWSLPWHGTAHAILSVLMKEPHDYIQFGENTWAFSHALLSQQAATTPVARSSEGT